MRKSFFFAVICVLLVPVWAMAQSSLGTGRTVEERAQRQTNQMAKTLSLDSVQIQQVRDLNLKYAQKVDKVLASDQERTAKREAIAQLATDKDTELRSILTEEQFAQWKQLQVTRQEQVKSKKEKKKAKNSGQEDDGN